MADRSDERRRLEREMARLLTQLGELQDEMETARPGPLRRRWIAWRTRRLEREIADLRARWEASGPD
jgi:hypothetical protein